MAKAVGTIVIKPEVCKGCEICILACPQKCISMGTNINLKGYTYVIQDDTKCVGCASCGIVCPDAAIDIYKEAR